MPLTTPSCVRFSGGSRSTGSDTWKNVSASSGYRRRRRGTGPSWSTRPMPAPSGSSGTPPTSRRVGRITRPTGGTCSLRSCRRTKPADPGPHLSPGDSGEDTDAISRLARDLERPAQARRPLAHRLEAEVTGEVVASVEADAVVGDPERKALGRLFQLQFHVGRAGVFDRVVQGFLNDAVQGLFDLQGCFRLPVQLGLDPYAVARLDGGCLFFEGGDQALLLQRFWPELEDQGSHLGHPGFGEGGGVIQGLGGAFWVVGQELTGRLDPERYAVEGLGDGVVQLTGQPLALFEGGLAAGLGEEPGVLDSDGRLIGHGPQEYLLVLAGLSIGEEAEEHRSQRPALGDKRQAVGDVPWHLTHEAMDGSIQRVGEDVGPEVVPEDGTEAAERLEVG